jgi:hypothetical protein
VTTHGELRGGIYGGDAQRSNFIRRAFLRTVVKLVDDRHTQKFSDLPAGLANPLPVGQAEQI